MSRSRNLLLIGCVLIAYALFAQEGGDRPTGWALLLPLGSAPRPPAGTRRGIGMPLLSSQVIPRCHLPTAAVR